MNNNPLRSKAAVRSFAAALILCVELSPATAEVLQITGYSGSSAVFSEPVIAGNSIAWYANPTSSSGVPNYFIYNVVTHLTNQITAYSGSNGRWSTPVISTAKVVWYANPTSATALPNYFMYDIGSGVTTQITSYGGSSGRWSEPVLSGDKMAWYASPTNASQLPNYFIYDAASGMRRQITSYSGSSGSFSSPVISNGRVVWKANPTSSLQLANYFIYDVATGLTRQITAYSGSSGILSEPVIDNDKVAWYANPNSASGVPNYFVYDVGTAVTTQITSYSGTNGRWSNPVVSNGKVAWNANPTSTGVPNFFVYDTATGMRKQFTAYSGSNGVWSDPVIANNRIVWYASPTSATSVPNYFVYDLTTGHTNQITSYSGSNGRWSIPSISNNRVVWYANPTSTGAPNYFTYDFASATATTLTTYSGGNGHWNNQPVISDSAAAWWINATNSTATPNYFTAIFVHTPTNIFLSNTSIGENQPVNTVVGALTTGDADTTDTHTYSLVSGTGSADNGSFNISASNLRASASFNFEAKGSYNIRVRTTDQTGLFFEKAFAIAVTNLNEAPSNISLSNTSIAENQPNTVVGALTSTDADAGDTFTYTLVSGTGSTDNNSFKISVANLRNQVTFDYETKNSYSIRVRATDLGGLFVEQAFVITITDVNEPPSTPSNVSPANLAANQPLAPTLTSSPFSDQDAGDSHAASQWVIRRASDSVVAYDSGTNMVNKTSIEMPSGQLAYGTTYNWQVRYQDAGGLWSTYSAQTAFTTLAPTLTIKAESGVILSWPTNAPGFALQLETNAGAFSWTPITNAPNIFNDQYVVTNPVVGPVGFFRLGK